MTNVAGAPISECRVCSKRAFVPIIDFGNQPWCNHFLKAEEVGHEPSYPLRLVYCTNCATVQLDYTVPKEVMFANHTYLSGTTETNHEHFRGLASFITREFFDGKTGNRIALDIGSNDGTQLKAFQDAGWHVLGVESAEIPAQMALDQGIPTLRSFFTSTIARDYKDAFDLITAANVFYHLEDLHDVADGIRIALAPDGIFATQCIYMKDVVDSGTFDQIYHEHLLYYNLRTLQLLLQRHGLYLFDVLTTPILGGSFVAFASKERNRPWTDRLLDLMSQEDARGANTRAFYEAFAYNILGFRDSELETLWKRKAQGKTIYGFGAPAKGNTLLNFFKVGPDMLPYLVERNPLRKGLYSPGMHIPILMEDEVEAQPDVYYVLAWNFRQEILKRNKHLLQQGVEFLFPRSNA